MATASNVSRRNLKSTTGIATPKAGQQRKFIDLKEWGCEEVVVASRPMEF